MKKMTKWSESNTFQYRHVFYFTFHIYQQLHESKQFIIICPFQILHWWRCSLSNTHVLWYFVPMVVTKCQLWLWFIKQQHSHKNIWKDTLIQNNNLPHVQIQLGFCPRQDAPKSQSNHWRRTDWLCPSSISVEVIKR